MSLNNGLHTLYSSTDLVVKYHQIFNYNMGLAFDSAYINHIEELHDQIIIKFPEQINLITNVVVYGAKYKFIDGNKLIDSDIINTQKYKDLKMCVYDIKEYYKLKITYDVYLFKKKLLCAL